VSSLLPHLRVQFGWRVAHVQHRRANPGAAQLEPLLRTRDAQPGRAAFERSLRGLDAAVAVAVRLSRHFSACSQRVRWRALTLTIAITAAPGRARLTKCDTFAAMAPVDTAATASSERSNAMQTGLG
jgi:hypothetical protein